TLRANSAPLKVFLSPQRHRSPSSRCSRNQRRDTMQIAKISTFALATALILAGIATWANSSHSAVENSFEGLRIDPFSIMVNAKDLPTQEEVNRRLEQESLALSGRF